MSWLPGSLHDQVTNRLAAQQAQAPQEPDAIFAQLTREEYRDYEQNLQPFEDLAAAAVLDPERRGQLMNQAQGLTKDAVNNAYDAAAGQSKRLRSRFNIKGSDRVKKSERISNAVNRSAAMVGARNATTQYFRDREIDLLGGT